MMNSMTPLQTVDVSFVARHDGAAQRYVQVLPPGYERRRPCPLLIALHGHGSDRWQFIQQERDECLAVRDFARQEHMILVSPDYRASTSWMGPAATADMRQIIAKLRREHRISAVYIAGASMGGLSALAFAAMHPEGLAGVCAMNGLANILTYDQFTDAIAASYGGPPWQRPEVYKQRSAEHWPERFTMPVGFTVSGQDTVVPPDSVRRLATALGALRRPALLIDRPERGHDTGYTDAMTALEFMLHASTMREGR